MKNRFMLTISCLLTVAAVLLWWGHSPTVSAQKVHSTESKGEPMNIAAKRIPADKTLPSIDASASAAYETASFGLG